MIWVPLIICLVGLLIAILGRALESLELALFGFFITLAGWVWSMLNLIGTL